MTKRYDLTGGGIRQHIRRMAIPAAIGLVCQTLFNMTDTFYVGYISTDAQSALAFSFPLFFILLSCCVGISQALTARAANAIGAGKRARASYFVGQAAVLAMIFCAVIWGVLVPLTGSILAGLGATDDVLEWGTQYSVIIYLAAPFFFGSFLLYGALQSVGNTTAFRNSLVFSVLLNIVLDPLFIFGWFGLPKMGVAGVAVATLLSQLCGAAYLLMKLSKTILASRWRWVFLRPRWRWIWQLTKQSTAPMGRMLCIGFGFFVVIGFLGRLDDTAVAAYGIALRVEQLFLLPMIGLEIALLSYAGQNLGAGNIHNTRVAYRLCLRYGFIFIITTGVILVLGGRYLIAIFNTDEVVIAHGQHYLYAAALAGPCYLLVNTAGAVLMGAQRVMIIAVSSIVRLIISPIILFCLFVFVFDSGVNGIWLGIWLATVLPALWLHRQCIALLKQGRSALAHLSGSAPKRH